MYTNSRGILRFEQLESRSLLAATVAEHDGIGYFFDDDSSRVDRFDIADEVWLDPIHLNVAVPTSKPTSVHVDNDGIYAAYGRSVYRFDLTGTNRTHLINTQDDVIALHSDGNLLFINHTSGLYARFISIDKSRNTIIDTFENYVESVSGSSISATLNRIFGRSIGVSPSDLTYVDYTDSGFFTNGGDSPYHGDYPSATQTWVFPDGKKVIDSSGIVYAAEGLSYIGSLASSVTDIDFLGSDVPIVLSGRTVKAFSSTRLPTGSALLPSVADKIFVNDRDVIAFTSNGNVETGFVVQVLPLSELQPDTPGMPVDPVGLVYVPDKIEVAANGNLLILSKSHQSLFRWSPVTQNYLTTIPLAGTPKFMTYSDVNNTVYLAYDSGLIQKIELSATQPVEVPFATLPGTPGGLSSVGEYLFAEDPSGAWATHYTFAADGTQLSAVDWNYYSKEYIWSEANRKMYFFRDDTSPNDLLSEVIDEDGHLGQRLDSPLHNSEGFQHPIRVSPSGDIVVLGSGKIHDAHTLARLPYALSNSIVDAAWINGELYTLRLVAGLTQIQQWKGATFELVDVIQRAEKPHALLSLTSDRLVSVLINDQGIPAFSILNRNLEPATVMPSWHNSQEPADVNGDSRVFAMDMLLVINHLHMGGAGEVPSQIAPAYLDTNADGFISPIDALVIVNWFNSQGNSSEAEAAFVPDVKSSAFAAWNDMDHLSFDLGREDDEHSLDKSEELQFPFDRLPAADDGFNQRITRDGATIPKKSTTDDEDTSVQDSSFLVFSHEPLKASS